MDRTSLRGAVLLAIALLAIAWSDAYAQTGAAPPDPTTPGTAPGPTAGGTTATPTAPDPPAGATPAAPTAPDPTAGGTAAPTAPDPTAGQQPVGGTPSAPGPSDPAAGAATSQTASASAPSSQTGAPASPIGGSAAPGPEPPGLAAPGSLTLVPQDDPRPQQALEPRTPSSAPAPALIMPIGRPPVGAVSMGSSPFGSPERLLPSVERELLSLQTTIDALQRRLNGAELAPEILLVRLRRSLERIAPALLALDARLNRAGRLLGRTRELLRRVRLRLTHAQVSTAGLIAQLFQAGVRDHALWLLARDLDGFGALRVALAPSLAAAPPPAAWDPRLQVALPQPDTAVAASPGQVPAAAASSADGRPTTESSDGGGLDAPPLSSSAPGSVTASPGGAFFAAGLASLAALLIGLALPSLWARLVLAPRRGYAAVFLTPLERPG